MNRYRMTYRVDLGDRGNGHEIIDGVAEMVGSNADDAWKNLRSHVVLMYCTGEWAGSRIRILHSSAQRIDE